MHDLTEHLVSLIKSTSTDLPEDIERALSDGCAREEEGSTAQGALRAILKNVRMSRETGRPICQDTGTPIFYVWYPDGGSQRKIRKQIQQALRQATERTYMRPNAVAALSGQNSGDNTGEGFPTIHFEDWERDELKIGLMLKGGGCENCGRQYTIPSPDFPASRDIEGVHKAVLDAACKAQGLGCAPGILGVAVGGDRGSGMIKAKEQLFRPLGDRSPNPELARLEQLLYTQINELGIGPMGFGGKTTVLGVKIAELHRVPASFFVSISYMCWADRRKTMTIKGDNVTIDAP